MKTKLSISLFLLGICIMFSGCYPYSTAYVEELDIVITDYDAAYSFKGKPKYALPDSIVKVTGNRIEGEPPVCVKEPYNSMILNRIRSNMTSLGYEEVNATDPDVDLLLFPAALETTYQQYYYDYYYYWGWYYPYYGGWYYPYATVTTYTTGTLLMNLVAAGEISASGNMHIVWTGLINGVLDYYGSDGDARLTKAIDQSFNQSDYLHQ